jgi:glycosyltransferase involved in cell wall biosynthesis
MKGELIIYFAGMTRGEWEFLCQREQELAARISIDNRVLYIERLGSINRNPLDLLRRLWNRIKTNSYAKISCENLNFYFPFIIPIHGISFIRELNSHLLSLQIKKKLESLNLNGGKPVIWVSGLADYVLDTLPRLKTKLIVYDCHQVYFPDQPEEGKRLDQKMAQLADLIFADSIKIYQGKKEINKNTYRIPQGVNLTIFKPTAKEEYMPIDLKDIRRPLIGYIGGSHSAFDFDLVSYLAEKRPHWSFILVGGIEDKKGKFNSLPNVYLLGSKKHEELPGYLRYFDVCTIPYLVNEYTETVFPTKLFEYLAAGKPVVSTFMPDLVRYEKFVKIAKDYQEFLTHAENFLAEEKKGNKKSDFYSLVKENTWEKRLDDIYQIISIRLNEKNGKLENLRKPKGARRNAKPVQAVKNGTSKNVLLLGFGFYLHKKSGDKNFWLNLSRELSLMLDKIVIVSVNSSPAKFEQEGNIYQYNFLPSFHLNNSGERGTRLQFLKASPPWRVIQRSATLIRLIPFLKRIVKLHQIQVIHLMDNFGFLTGMVKLFFPKLKVYATGITYNTHGFPSKPYSFYQRIVFGNLDKIAVSSKAYKDKLVEHGFSNDKVKVIRWGVPVENGKKRLPKTRKTNRHNRVVLWTGFTQQIKEKSFYLSLSVAQSIIRKNSSVDFIFAFKPECFDKKFGVYQEKNLKIITTEHQDFLELLEKVDLLLAPVENLRSTVAPPLSWIECMSLGIPVISTQAPGADEVLKPNLTGFVAKSNQELESLIEKVVEDKNQFKEVSSNAKKWVKENYNLKDIAQDYLKLWGETWQS